MGFSRQEYWSGLPCPPPGDLPDPGIEPEPLKSIALAGRFFTVNANWEAQLVQYPWKNSSFSSPKPLMSYLCFNDKAHYSYLSSPLHPAAFHQTHQEFFSPLCLSPLSLLPPLEQALATSYLCILNRFFTAPRLQLASPGPLVGCHLWGRTGLDTTEAT